MAESFVKTIKRDYVYSSDCETAEIVSEMLPKWIKDYNENAPHSALGMLNPMEYKKLTLVFSDMGGTTKD